jgi:hypothetical protein
MCLVFLDGLNERKEYKDMIRYKRDDRQEHPLHIRYPGLALPFIS